MIPHRNRDIFSDHKPSPGNGLDAESLWAWDTVPSWLRDNEYVLTGYRPAPLGSLRECIQSLEYVHNETVNIYTHLLGFLLFASLPLYAYYYGSWPWPLPMDVEKFTTQDLLVFTTFFVGVTTCFFLSTTYHVVACHSPGVQKLAKRLDYLGIVILMWSSTVSSVYYGFYYEGEEELRQTYWIAISAFALVCVAASLLPSFRHPSVRPWRAGMYALLGLSSVVFVGHALRMHGLEGAEKRMSVGWMVAMGGLNLLGAGIYGARVSMHLYFAYFSFVIDNIRFLLPRFDAKLTLVVKMWANC